MLYTVGLTEPAYCSSYTSLFSQVVIFDIETMNHQNYGCRIALLQAASPPPYCRNVAYGSRDFGYVNSDVLEVIKTALLTL